MSVAGGIIAPPVTRFAAYAVTAVLLLFALVEGGFVISAAVSHSGTIGLDFTMYQERTADWLAGGSFYRDRQLDGPYPIVAGDALYPPVLLLLTVPASVLPAVLWWLVPLGLIAAAVVRCRPSPWGWAILAALLVYPQTWMDLLYGNPAIWSFAFLAAGMAWAWPAAFVPLKLTLAPFALVGVRRRSWWLAAGVALALCVPFGLLWLDYATALVNARNPFGLGYLLGDWPIALGIVVGLSSRAGARGGYGSAPSWRRRSAPASDS